MKKQLLEGSRQCRDRDDDYDYYDDEQRRRRRQGRVSRPILRQLNPPVTGDPRDADEDDDEDNDDDDEDDDDDDDDDDEDDDDEDEVCVMGKLYPPC